MAAPADSLVLAAALERIEHKLDELLAKERRKKRGVAKRRATVAERSAARVESEPVEYQPTELQRARVRRVLLARRAAR